MAKQTISLGSAPNDGTGDPLRTALDKVNDNFDEVYNVYSFTGNTSLIGNGTVNSVSNSTSLKFTNSTANATLTSSSLVIGNSVVNTTIISLGANVIVNTSTIFIGNSTVNSIVNSTAISFGVNSTAAILIANTSKLGIRNSAPTYDFDQYKNANNSLVTRMQNANTSANASSVLQHQVGSSYVNNFVNSIATQVVGSTVVTAYTDFDTQVWRKNDGTERIRLGANGNVGIGNATPVHTLSIAGNIAVSTNTFSLGSSTSSANGYTYLPNGLKMAWGWVSANSTTGNATFSAAYTTNAYVVTATSNTTTATYQAAVISVNNTVVAIRTANATSTNVFYMAIGS